MLQMLLVANSGSEKMSSGSYEKQALKCVK